MTPPAPPSPPDWKITRPRHVAATGIADVWRVESRWGPAALKHFRGGDARNEAGAPAWLGAMAGPGVVRVFAEAPGSLLLAWQEGPLLGERSRNGEDASATETLAGLTSRLLQRSPHTRPAFPDLATWVAPVFALNVGAGWTAQDRAALAEALALARHLLATAPPPRLLHGDLHHDNIIDTAAGPVAIDPKGLWGDPAYELANAFRNPKGFAGCTEAAIQRARLEVFADMTGLAKARLAGWAMVKCLLSSAWAKDDPALVRFNLDVFQTLRDSFADLRLLP